MNPVITSAGVVDNTSSSVAVSLIGKPVENSGDTLFGVLYKILSKLSKLDTLATSSQITTLSQKMEASSGVVKSVQRGTASGNQTITINAVNPDKCIVLIDDGSYLYEYDDYISASYLSYAGCYLSSFTSTSITIAGASMTIKKWTGDGSWGHYTTTLNIPYSWQVIEYY